MTENRTRWSGWFYPVTIPSKEATMKKLTLIERQPLAVLGGVGVAVTALIHLLVEFGIPITERQQTAVGGVVDAVGLLVILFLGHKAVTPNSKVVSRTTTEGQVVAGDASQARTGSVVDIVADPTTGEPVPVTPVKPELVAEESLPPVA